jgi:hypothetical protein
MICRKALLFICVIFLFLPRFSWAQDLKVFILHSYHAGFVWTEDQQKGFLEALGASTAVGKVSYRIEYLEAATRECDSPYLGNFHAYLQQKYTGFKPDLIYATDDNAVEFLRQYARQLFPQTPVIYSGLNDPDLDGRLDHEFFYGVIESEDVAGTVTLAMRLAPELKTLYFVGDDSTTSHGIRKRIEKEAQRVFPQVDIDFIQSPYVEELERQLNRTKPSLCVVNSLAKVRNTHGERLTISETLERLEKAGESIILAMKDN